MQHRVARVGLCAMLALAIPVPGAAADGACIGGAAPSATVVALGGTVQVRPDGGAPAPARLGQPLCPRDQVQTGADGRVELQFSGADTTVGLSRNASLQLGAPGGADVRFGSGLLKFISSVRGAFTIETRHANAGIDGTEAVLALERPDGPLGVVVVEGSVRLGAADAAIVLDQGAAGIAGQDLPPRAVGPGQAAGLLGTLVADPAGAADWAIYYPPILAGAGGVPGAAAVLLDAGDPAGAAALLAGPVPARERPGALTLSSLIAGARGDRTAAAARAAEALALDPGFAPAWVAASYAAQGRGDIDAARDAAARARRLAPDEPHTAARVAELALIAGDRAGAIRDARRAVALGPTALGQAVLGLALLASNDPGGAQGAFGAAIATDSRAPLGHLGRGLTLIRQGEVAPGRRALELAVALDPRRAATRTWLGRAYATEGDRARAMAQFDLAKARDPDDPTPWLLAAQELYAANRPNEALAEIGAATDRGGARATQRSATGLAEDRAVAAASLGRVLTALGFDRQAELAGAAAAEADHTNPAAQRLRADAAGDTLGRDITRASANLAALVYDGPSDAPVAAAESEAGLALFDPPGAARASLTEFAPFFGGDGVRGVAQAGIGTQGTLTDQISVTALADRFSLGLGQFHYQTDGVRAGNDVRHDVVSLQAKAELTPWLDVFGEYRYRESQSGDRVLEFDRVADDPSLRAGDERNLGRLGFHATLGADHDIAALVTHARLDAEARRETFGFAQIDSLDRSGTELQAQHVGRFGAVEVISGLAYARINDRSATQAFFGNLSGRDRSDRFTAYTYGTLRLDDLGPLAGAALTLGLGYDNASSDIPGLSVRAINPKLGARIWVTEDLVLRAAFTRTVKPPQFMDQRLEPVSVAGFDQYFDDFEGAEIQQVGLGADWRVLPWATVGVEGVVREIDNPIGFSPQVGTDVRGLRAYADAVLGPRVAVGLAFTHETSTSSDAFDLAEFDLNEVRGRVGYFHPSGFFGAVELGYAWTQAFTFQALEDDFPLVEAVMGYRLPGRRGLLSLGVQNVLDTDFGFVDRQANAAGTPFSRPRYARDLTVFAQATLAF